MVSRSLNDFDGLILDFFLVLASTKVNVCLEILDIINGQCEWLLAMDWSWDVKWEIDGIMLVVWNVYNVILLTKVKVIIIGMIHNESWFQWSILS